MSAWRQLPPVTSPVTTAMIVAALTGSGSRETTERELARRLGGRTVLLTDSGTSALALALRVAVANRPGLPCALPAYGCFDLVSAALAAGVGIVFYDIDPDSLLPDHDSVEQQLVNGVAALVIVHQYGLPVPVDRLVPLAASHGAILIDDAAQGFGGRIGGSPLGSLGDLGVLSFARGKGTTAGGGGALVVRDSPLAAAIAKGLESEAPSRMTMALKLLAQLVLGRPGLYALPSALPWLRLGETVYREPNHPLRMATARAAVLRASLRTTEAEVARRAANARHVIGEVAASARHRLVLPRGADSSPAWLRLPVRAKDTGAARETGRHLGCVRGYPLTLDQVPVLGEAQARPSATPGAHELTRSLWTVPVHGRMMLRDLDSVARWIEARER